jgi:hypothetical protein
MLDKLQDIIGVLLILGVLVLLKRVLDSFFGQKPPTKPPPRRQQNGPPRQTAQVHGRNVRGR